MLLLPYQKAWISDTSRIKLMEKSRQIGMTWAAACGLVRQQALSGSRYDAWVSSRDEVQARLFIEDCAKFANIYDKAARDCGQSFIDDGQKNTTYTLQFANGRRIHSLSSNADAQAGKRGTRILDEFALHPDPRTLYAIAYPGITWGGSLEIISTHRGSNNFFNRLIEEIKHKGNPKNISLHTVTLQNAIEQGFLEKLQVRLPDDDPRKHLDPDDYLQHARNGCPDEESWLQEYCCKPADDVTAFLPENIIAPCEVDGQVANPQALTVPDTSTRQTTGRPGHAIPGARGAASAGSGRSVPIAPHSTLYLGVDLARTHDLTVFWLLERHGDVLHTRDIIVLRDTPFRHQEERLYELLALPQLKRCCIDQSGLGRQFAERAIERYGRYRIEGLTLTNTVKEELAYPVRAAFENRAIRIPGDPVTRADLRAIRKETTSSGNIRFTADRGKDGHADRFWALALALHAARTPHVAHFSESIRRPHDGAIV